MGATAKDRLTFTDSVRVAIESGKAKCRECGTELVRDPDGSLRCPEDHRAQRTDEVAPS